VREDFVAAVGTYLLAHGCPPHSLHTFQSIFLEYRYPRKAISLPGAPQGVMHCYQRIAYRRGRKPLRYGDGNCISVTVAILQFILRVCPRHHQPPLASPGIF
jgi:hypothetical protein